MIFMTKRIDAQVLKITKDRVLSAGKHDAQRAVLRDLQEAIGELIEHVRGEDELTIELKLTKAEKSAKSSTRTQSGGSDGKPSSKTNSNENAAKRSSSETAPGKGSRRKPESKTKKTDGDDAAQDVDERTDSQEAGDVEQAEDPLKAVADEKLG